MVYLSTLPLPLVWSWCNPAVIVVVCFVGDQVICAPKDSLVYPIGSMYGIFTYIVCSHLPIHEPIPNLLR